MISGIYMFRSGSIWYLDIKSKRICLEHQKQMNLLCPSLKKIWMTSRKLEILNLSKQITLFYYCWVKFLHQVLHLYRRCYHLNYSTWLPSSELKDLWEINSVFLEHIFIICFLIIIYSDTRFFSLYRIITTIISQRLEIRWGSVFARSPYIQYYRGLCFSP